MLVPSIPGTGETEYSTHSIQSKKNRASLFIPGISHRVERIIDGTLQTQGVELLVVDPQHPESPENLLREAKGQGVTGEIFELGLMKILTRIRKLRIGGKSNHITRSINTYVADLSGDNFQKEMTDMIQGFEKEDLSKVIIELLEEPHGKVMRSYMQNVRWLKEQGFQIAIDDYNLMEEEKTRDMSRRNLGLFGSKNEQINVVDRIKLDHKITQKLLMGDPLAMRKLSELRKKYPQIPLVTEGISKNPETAHSQIATLKPLGIQYFQIYSGPGK